MNSLPSKGGFKLLALLPLPLKDMSYHTLTELNFFNIVCVNVYVHVCEHSSVSMWYACVQVRRQPVGVAFLLPCGSQGPLRWSGFLHEPLHQLSILHAQEYMALLWHCIDFVLFFFLIYHYNHWAMTARACCGFRYCCLRLFHDSGQLTSSFGLPYTSALPSS